MHNIYWSSLNALYVLLCKVLKVLTLFKNHGDITKTGDTLSLRCRFQSNTYSKVVKASTWKLLYMILMKIKCAWHLLCEVGHRGFRVMSLFEIGIHIEKFCVSNFFNSFQVIFNFCSWFSLFPLTTLRRGYTHHKSVIVLYLIDSYG